MSTNEDEFTLIYAYTREQALADGVLVDVSDLTLVAKSRNKYYYV